MVVPVVSLLLLQILVVPLLVQAVIVWIVKLDLSHPYQNREPHKKNGDDLQCWNPIFDKSCDHATIVVGNLFTISHIWTWWINGKCGMKLEEKPLVILLSCSLKMATACKWSHCWRGYGGGWILVRPFRHLYLSSTIHY
jgi:hypothetical protein